MELTDGYSKNTAKIFYFLNFNMPFFLTLLDECLSLLFLVFLHPIHENFKAIDCPLYKALAISHKFLADSICLLLY